MDPAIGGIAGAIRDITFGDHIMEMILNPVPGGSK